MRPRAVASILAALIAAPPAAADVHGRFELQDFAAFAAHDSIDTVLGLQKRNDLAGNLRVKWEPQWDRWSFSVHFVMDADYGDGVRLARARSGLLSAPPSTLFNLTNVFEDRGNFRADQRVDRLFFGYATPGFVVRVGRHALTWGGGLVFRPMDLFNPFSPNSTDTEFKPGTDMIYAQWLFGDGSDLQTIAVPRPSTRGGAPAVDASSFALLWRKSIADIQTTWLVARDHGDWTVAAEFGGPLGGATWDVELVPVFPQAGAARLSALANISDAITLFDRNATVFAEYFHNGFGTTAAHATFATLPPALLDRLSRGQLFSLRENYLAAGVTLELTPLVSLTPSVIADLDDGSFYALASATWSLSDDLMLVAGTQIPVGPRGSEYGGLPLSPATNATAGPSPQIYVQLRRYF